MVLKGNNFSPQEKEKIRNLLPNCEIDGELLPRKPRPRRSWSW
ncbi:hypothetical protein LEP1GSC188_0365 [Leptospira weilii serovar Topaz str. LT2116]|uniref:Uncharacterized protein n=1 Tax=Leptospira weilii serovar Topaz str. LT2116 TaxID=1088540 RepID=M3GEJ0_9LEPT|nr:hypothetical protein LEP1GSC188_0365 [Leptospira weilii serovar Topaz str. LT2116]